MSTQKDTEPVPRVRVDIYGQSYTLRSDADSDYIKQLARFVDERMREISAHTFVVDSLKIAILAALNIADELHRAKQISDRDDTAIGSVSSECSQALDGLLEKGTAGPENRESDHDRQQAWSYEDIFKPLSDKSNATERLGDQVAARLQSRRIAMRSEISMHPREENE